MEPPAVNNFQDFMMLFAEPEATAGVVVIMAIFSSSFIAREFDRGTIKLLAMLPISRTKLLLSKFSVILLFTIIYLGILFVTAILAGFMVTTFNNISEIAYIDPDNQVKTFSFWKSFSLGITLSFLTVVIVSSVGFFSVWTKNNSISLGITLLIFVAPPICCYIKSKYVNDIILILILLFN